MKLSNKILLSIFTFAIIFCMAFIIVVGKTQFTPVFANEKLNEWQIKQLAVTPFDQITLDSDFEVYFENGEDYNVQLRSMNDDHLTVDIIPEITDGHLKFTYNNDSRQTNNNFNLLITTPNVKGIILNNNASITIQGLNQDSLQLSLSDHSSGNLVESHLKKLGLKSNGESHFTIQKSTADSVIVDIRDSGVLMTSEIDFSVIYGNLSNQSWMQINGEVQSINCNVSSNSELIKTRNGI